MTLGLESPKLESPTLILVCVYDSEEALARQALGASLERRSHCPELSRRGQAPSPADPGALGGPEGGLTLERRTVSI